MSAPASLRPAVAAAPKSRARMLVVDDEPGMLRAMERILAPLHDVRAARLPSQALEYARTETFDIALLDVRMPEMDGFALMERLAQLQPGIDVILMTGSTDERDERLVRAIREKAFFFLTKPFDRDVLLTLVERCLDVHRLDAENRAHVERLEAELAAARAFQEQMLPPRTFDRHGVRLVFHCDPSTELCGDFCDYVIGPESGTVLVADVSGHGAPAAMLTGMVKLVFRATLAEGGGPAEIVAQLQASTTLAAARRHLTAIAVRVRPRDGLLEWVNAGHPSGLLVRGGGAIERLESTAPLLHPALPRFVLNVSSARLGLRDRVVLFSDGMIEAHNADGGEFGFERLEAAVRGAAEASSVGTLHKAVLEAWAAFVGNRPTDDDHTLLVMERS
jgi:serine phosphatase RsbU (regulator of sigma subunit)